MSVVSLEGPILKIPKKPRQLVKPINRPNVHKHAQYKTGKLRGTELWSKEPYQKPVFRTNYGPITKARIKINTEKAKKAEEKRLKLGLSAKKVSSPKTRSKSPKSRKSKKSNTARTRSRHKWGAAQRRYSMVRKVGEPKIHNPFEFPAPGRHQTFGGRQPIQSMYCPQPDFRGEDYSTDEEEEEEEEVKRLSDSVESFHSNVSSSRHNTSRPSQSSYSRPRSSPSERRSLAVLLAQAGQDVEDGNDNDDSTWAITAFDNAHTQDTGRSGSTASFREGYAAFTPWGESRPASRAGSVSQRGSPRPVLPSWAQSTSLSSLHTQAVEEMSIGRSRGQTLGISQSVQNLLKTPDFLLAAANLTNLKESTGDKPTRQLATSASTGRIKRPLNPPSFMRAIKSSRPPRPRATALESEIIEQKKQGGMTKFAAGSTCAKLSGQGLSAKDFISALHTDINKGLEEASEQLKTVERKNRGRARTSDDDIVRWALNEIDGPLEHGGS